MQIIQKPVEVSEGCWLFWSCEGLEFSKCIQRSYIPSATAFPRPISRHRHTRCTSHLKLELSRQEGRCSKRHNSYSAQESKKQTETKTEVKWNQGRGCSVTCSKSLNQEGKNKKNKFTTLSSLLMGKKNNSAHHRYFLLATFRLIQSQSFQQSPV